MKTRLAVLLFGVALVATACSSGASGDTTTTASESAAPDTSPSSVEIQDQTSDGTTIVVATVTLPSPGFVAVHVDNNGSPGSVIGHSELLPAGISSNVTVVLDTPLDATSIVWPMVHIDLDGDGEYTFAPPDNAIDVPGITSDGSVAVASATITPTPDRAPSAIEAKDQEGLGLGVIVKSVTLPAPGFIAVHGDADGTPGPVIGRSGLLGAGTSTDVEITFDEPIDASGVVYPMVHIDLDGDGEYTFAPPDNAIDLPGLTESGDVAVVGIVLTVVPPTAPSALEAEDQDSDGTTVVIASVTLPASGFIAIHQDNGGSPGAVIGHSALLPAGESSDVIVTLDEPLTASGVVYPMVHIDLDADGEYTFAPPDDAIDVPGITEDGAVAVLPIQINL